MHAGLIGAPNVLHLSLLELKPFSCPHILVSAFLAFFSGKQERGFFPSCFPRAQHIWWDILPKEMESIAERWVTLFTGRKRPTSGRESHPPDLTFPGKSRRFTGRKEKYRGENLGTGWYDHRRSSAGREEDSANIWARSFLLKPQTMGFKEILTGSRMADLEN